MSFKLKPDSAGGDTIKFEKPGDNVIGVYVGAQDYPEGKFGPATKHMFRTADGLKVVFAKVDSQISNLLTGEEGKKVQLTFARTKPSGKGNPTKIYTLGVDEDYEPSTDDMADAAVYEDDAIDDDGDTTQETAPPPARTATTKAPTPNATAARDLLAKRSGPRAS